MQWVSPRAALRRVHPDRREIEELFASISHDPVTTVTQGFSKTLGKPIEHEIARGVSVGIIDLFEIINVTHDHRQ
jgi:hypothetical protein